MICDYNKKFDSFVTVDIAPRNVLICIRQQQACRRRHFAVVRQAVRVSVVRLDPSVNGQSLLGCGMSGISSGVLLVTFLIQRLLTF